MTAAQAKAINSVSIGVCISVLVGLYGGWKWGLGAWCVQLIIGSVWGNWQRRNLDPKAEIDT